MGLASSVTTVSLSVTNQAPVAVANIQHAVGQALTVRQPGVLTNDTDADGTP